MTRLDSQRRYNDLVQSGSSADGPANQEAGGNATGGDSNRDASTTSRSSHTLTPHFTSTFHHTPHLINYYPVVLPSS